MSIYWITDWFFECDKNKNLECFGNTAQIASEAIQNVASIYNTNHMKVSKITATDINNNNISILNDGTIIAKKIKAEEIQVGDNNIKLVNGEIQIMNSSGEKVVSLGSNDNNNGYIRIHKNNKKIIDIGKNDNGGGQISTYNSNKKLASQLYNDSQGGILKIIDKDGVNEKILLDVYDGKGRMIVKDKKK